MIENILLLALLAFVGGVVFVTVGVAFVKFLDIVENDYD